MGFINSIVDLDVKILEFVVANLKSPALDGIMRFFTLFGEAGIFWIAVTVVCLFFPKTRKMGVTMAVAMTIGFVIGNGIIKNAVARARPYEMEQFRDYLIIGKLSDYSFPSGHTLACFESAVAVFAYRKKWGVAALVLAFCVAVSRVYLVVHFPSDVLAGALLGTLFAVLAYFLVKWLFAKFGWDSSPLLTGERANNAKKEKEESALK